jgi:hypothetical protein
MINNKFFKWCKNNLRLVIISSSLVSSCLLTTILVNVLPDRYYKVESMNVMWGPQNFEVASHIDDGSPPHQFLKIHLNGELAPRGDIGNNIIDSADCDNQPYVCVPVVKRIGGGDIPRTKTHHKAFVDWELKQDNGVTLPDWLSIGQKDDENFGKIMWDSTKADWHPQEIFVVISATLGNTTSVADILKIQIVSN